MKRKTDIALTLPRKNVEALLNYIYAAQLPWGGKRKPNKAATAAYEALRKAYEALRVPTEGPE